MAEFRLGRLKFVWKGAWTGTTAYIKDDIVRYGGKSFVCTETHTSSTGFYTDLSSKWDLMSDGFSWQVGWTNSQFYRINDIVKFGGSLYLCKEAHTSGSSFDETKWDIFVEGLQFENTWSNSTEYQLGDIVAYGGYTYRSKVRNTNQTPSTAITYWEPFTEGVNIRGAWVDATLYKVADVVRYGGNLYLCTADTDSAIPEDTEFWTLFSEGLQWVGQWSDNNVEYKVGELVKDGPTTYICIQSNTSDYTHANQPINDTGHIYWDIFADGASTAVLTTLGDTLYRSGIGQQRLPIGSAGDIYVVNAAGEEPEWSTTADITVNSISITTGDINTNLGNITTTNGNISTTLGDISTAEGDIFTIAGDISTAEGDISTAVGNVSVSGDGANGKITSTNHITVDAFGVNAGAVYVGKDAELQTVDDGAYTGFTDAAGVFTRDIDAYAQVALKNLNAGDAASSDWIAYADNGDTNSGWIDMGITSSVFNDATYGITGPNDGYIFMSAPEGTTGNGNLYISTNNTGLQNDIVFSTNGFGRISSEKMRLIGVSHDGLQPGLEIDVSVETTVDNPAGYSASATTITVDSTLEFPASGTIIIGSEEITYAGKTSTSFDGLTRGANGTTAATIDNAATVTSITESISPTTGALRVLGGIGLTGALNAEGDIVAAGGVIYQGESSTGVTAKHLTQDDSLYTGYVGLTDTSGVFTGDANAFVQFALKNHNSGDSASTDIIAYASNGDNDSGWIDMGITSGSYDDPDFTVTGPDTGYLFMSAPAGTTSTGNLLIGTSDTGVENDIIVFSNGFDGGNERLRIVGAARPGHALGVEVLAPTESTSTTTGALRVNGGMGLIGNLNVGGNVSIIGTISIGGAGSSLETTSLAVTDPVIRMGKGNIGDTVDLGFISETTSANTVVAGGTLSSSNTTVTVTSTTGFSSTGTIVISDEEITYTGKTSTTFTGCTRGVNGSVATTHDAAVVRQVVYGGLVRDASDSSIYKLFKGLTGNRPTSTIDFSVPGVSYSDLDVGRLKTTSAIDSSSTSTGSLIVAGGAGINSKLYVGGIANFASTVNVASNIASVQSTVDLLNDTVTTINAFGAGTSINVGATSGTLTFKNPTIDTTSSSLTLFNTTASTINAFGAGTSINVGATSGTLTIKNPNVVGNQTTVNLWNSTSTTVNFAGASTATTIGASSGTITLNGMSSINQVQETLNTKTSATGTVVHDFSTGAIFFHSSISANFTANFTNMPTTANKAYAVTLVLSQGGTGYYPNAVQINGSAVTLRWANNITPTPSTNKIDIIAFTLFYTSSTWYCTAQYTNFA